MALPFIVAALLGKAAATKVVAGKAATAGAKAAAHRHAQGGLAREVIRKVADTAKDTAEDKAKEKAKSWWGRRKDKQA